MASFKDVPSDVPAAESTQWYKCSHCDNLHVILLDMAGVPIATMTCDLRMLAQMIKVAEGPPTYASDGEHIH
jgi:hypothetical protein